MRKIYFLRQKKGSFGGAENYLARLQNELSKRGILYENINLKAPSFLPSWLKAMLFSFLSCKNKKDKLYFSLDRISCSDIYRAGDGVHREFLTTKKSSLNPLNLVYLYLEKQLFTNSKLIIANSNMVKKEIIKHYQTDENKIKVIHNGVEHKEVCISLIEALTKELNLDRTKKTILFVGSGFERKGVMEFLMILSKLQQPFNAIVVGKDKKLSIYKQKAQELGLNVKFVGKRDDVDSFYALSDIFLFPTKYEPFSNVILEAMSFGSISFTTTQNGASEVLPQDQIIDEKISKTLDTLLENKALLKEKKEQNYRLSLGYTIERNTTQTLEVIDEYLH